MNLWAGLALVVLAVGIPITSFGLGLATQENSGMPEREQEAWALGIMAVSLTLADIIWILN